MKPEVELTSLIERHFSYSLIWISLRMFWRKEAMKSNENKLMLKLSAQTNVANSGIKLILNSIPILNSGNEFQFGLIADKSIKLQLIKPEWNWNWELSLVCWCRELINSINLQQLNWMHLIQFNADWWIRQHQLRLIQHSINQI